MQKNTLQPGEPVGINNGVIELIELNLDSFRPYKSQFSEQQLADFKKLELVLDILSGKSSDSPVELTSNRISLEPDQTISINGAILNKELIDFLLYLQQGHFYPGQEDTKQNDGIEDQKKDCANLILFLSSAADGFDDKEEFAGWITSINGTMKQWDHFRIPGTYVDKPFFSMI